MGLSRVHSLGHESAFDRNHRGVLMICYCLHNLCHMIHIQTEALARRITGHGNNLSQIARTVLRPAPCRSPPKVLRPPPSTGRLYLLMPPIALARALHEIGPGFAQRAPGFVTKTTNLDSAVDQVHDDVPICVRLFSTKLTIACQAATRQMANRAVGGNQELHSQKSSLQPRPNPQKSYISPHSQKSSSTTTCRHDYTRFRVDP